MHMTKGQQISKQQLVIAQKTNEMFDKILP